MQRKFANSQDVYLSIWRKKTWHSDWQHADKGIIRSSSSPWASPNALVRKKNGSLRFYIDFRRLHNVPVKDTYLLPRIDEPLDALGGSKWLSTSDMIFGKQRLMRVTYRRLPLRHTDYILSLILCPLAYAMWQEHLNDLCRSSALAWDGASVWSISTISSFAVLLLRNI